MVWRRMGRTTGRRAWQRGDPPAGRRRGLAEGIVMSRRKDTMTSTSVGVRMAKWRSCVLC